MRAYLEKVSSDPESSFRFFLRKIDQIPFEWHFHPEYELTFTLHGEGERYVGDHVSTFSEPDLVFIGPNVPHSWVTNSKPPTDNSLVEAYVLWFSQQWIDSLTSAFPEFQPLRTLADEARRGVTFSNALATQLQPLFLRLSTEKPNERLISVLQILQALSSSSRQCLSSLQTSSQDLSQTELSRMNLVLSYLQQHYMNPLSLSEVAAVHHLSVSTLVRLFKRHTRQSVQQYLLQIRIGHACAKLIQSSLPIALIAEQSGFSNLSNFNRQFRKIKGETPRVFRDRFQSRRRERQYTNLIHPLVPKRVPK